ncbi:hypothetical protein TRIUR3_35342 [Triticum urartu]|uniref:RING-type E3 ubiquitin transferase n=1 Tax=Triticum urartu TaxID=4572 RepID=M8AKI7_TRIUA|nr:hypothetical protein TRIUR3_35342 [Triticum urartu]
MSTPQSGSASPATTAAAAVETSKHWAPHGPMLTACLVSINVLMILLIFFYFWRFFSGKRGPSTPGGADEESSSTDSSPATSPRASRRLRDPDQPDIPSSLPVSVFDSSSEAAGKAAADCAVCIVEFRDGDLARLLPRCGHRAGPGERRVPKDGDVGLRCLGLARVLFGLALKHLQALALPALLGQPNATRLEEKTRGEGDGGGRRVDGVRGCRGAGPERLRWSAYRLKVTKSSS